MRVGSAAMMDRYALLGNPIGHGKSSFIHFAFAKDTGQDIDYIALETAIGGFVAQFDAFRGGGGRGLDITTPFKLDAFACSTELRDRAKLAGAVNAMKIEGDRAIGDNFDGTGLTNDIQRNLGCPMRGRRILLLGAGGAVRGAIMPFLEQRPAELVIVNRTIEKAQELVRIFSPYGSLSASTYEALSDQPPFDLVVNGTAASMHGELPPLPAGSFAPNGLAYELAYSKGLTPFPHAARNAGVTRIADGVGMLVEQAAEAFEWWRDVRPDTGRLIEQLTMPLM